MTSIASGATSGANSTIILDADEGFNAVGDSGTADTSVASADLASNTFYVRKSKPTFAKLDAGTDPVNGALYKFAVVADNAGNIEIKQLSFTVSTIGCNVINLYLYDTSASTQLTDIKISPTTEGSSVKLIVGTDNDNDVLVIGTTPKTYELRGAVTGYSAAGDEIIVRFKQDTIASDTVLAATSIANGSYNVWSDRSSSAHSTATFDWTNGYLIKDMTQSQSFSK